MFPPRDEAAKAAEKWALQATDDTGRKWEYGGKIAKSDEDEYEFTVPITFHSENHFFFELIKLPSDYPVIADYHTHPHRTSAEGEGLSTGDEQHAYDFHRAMYEVDTFSRNLYRFLPGVSEYKKTETCCGVIGDFVIHFP